MVVLQFENAVFQGIECGTAGTCLVVEIDVEDTSLDVAYSLMFMSHWLLCRGEIEKTARCAGEKWCIWSGWLGGNHDDVDLLVVDFVGYSLQD
jgi:hypothetical protein